MPWLQIGQTAEGTGRPAHRERRQDEQRCDDDAGEPAFHRASVS